jgi:hypothetical protein
MHLAQLRQVLRQEILLQSRRQPHLVVHARQVNVERFVAAAQRGYFVLERLQLGLHLLELPLEQVGDAGRIDRGRRCDGGSLSDGRRDSAQRRRLLAHKLDSRGRRQGGAHRADFPRQCCEPIVIGPMRTVVTWARACRGRGTPTPELIVGPRG